MIPRKQAPPKKKLPLVPWMPVHYDVADVSAIQALNRGTASPEMQQRALAYIINTVAATYDEPYYNMNSEGRRDTDFALGRAFVGRQLVKLTKLDLGKLRKIEGEHL